MKGENVWLFFVNIIRENKNKLAVTSLNLINEILQKCESKDTFFDIVDALDESNLEEACKLLLGKESEIFEAQQEFQVSLINHQKNQELGLNYLL